MISNATGGVDFTSAGVLNGADDALVQVTFVENGFFSLAFEGSLESEIIADFAVIDFEGEIVHISSDFDPFGNMTATDDISGKTPQLAVSAGDQLTFGLIGDGFTTGGVISTFSVFDFIFQPDFTTFEVGNFTTTWGIVNAEDKTSPEAETVPEDINLLCVDFDGNNISTLPTSVDHCYRVNASNGATIFGSMANALRARLLAGTLSPVVPIFTDGCAQELEVCVSDALLTVMTLAVMTSLSRALS